MVKLSNSDAEKLADFLSRFSQDMDLPRGWEGSQVFAQKVAGDLYTQIRAN